MLGQIVKNLWNNRHRNLWIMLELIVISVVSWVVIDPIFVLNYNRLLPDGYDAEGLYRLQLMRNWEDSLSNPAEDYERIMARLRDNRYVDAATCVLRGAYPSSPGNNTSNIKQDTTVVTTTYIPFFRNSGFFRTWHFRSAVDGTWETLEKLEIPDDGIILSEDAAALLPDGRNIVGQTIFEPHRDSLTYKVMALMQPVKMRNGMQPYAVRLKPWIGEMPEWAYEGMRVFIRAKEGVSEERFMEEFLQWSDENLMNGSLVFQDFIPFHQMQEISDLEEGVTNEIRTKYILAAFFMFNLLLAVSGTFWMNTRMRREEVGIRLSYGASPTQIQRMLICEGWVLTTIAVLVGCFIYFQWAHLEGLYAFGDLFSWDKHIASNKSLYLPNHFIMHFTIVSLLVYAVMIVVTWLGVYIPAYSISKISPVEALRNE